MANLDVTVELYHRVPLHDLVKSVAIDLSGSRDGHEIVADFIIAILAEMDDERIDKLVSAYIEEE